MIRQINFTTRVRTSLIGMHGLQLDIGARDSIKCILVDFDKEKRAWAGHVHELLQQFVS